jgi:ligand-binding sensor domain-containing protein
MKKIYLFFAAALTLLILISIPSKAQLQFKNIASPNYITALAEEGNFVWVGTSNGLYKRNKSNGQIVSYFNKDNGLVNNAITSIAIDGQGNKWICTEQGVSKFNEIANTWTTYLQGSKITSVCIDIYGQKWFGGMSALYRFDGTNWKIYNSLNSPIGFDLITSLAFDDQNNLWMGTYHYGVYAFLNDTTTWLNYTYGSGLPDSTIISVACDNSGNKWFGTKGSGIVKFDGFSFSTYNSPGVNIAGNDIYSICIDALNNIWIGTSSGVSKFDGVSSFVNYHESDGLANNNVNSIIPDIQGNIWIGTTKGLSRFNGTLPITTYFFSNSLVDSYVNAVKKSSSGDFWFATNGGISKYTEASNYWKNYTEADGLLDPSIYDVDFGIGSTIWAGASTGLWKYDGNSWTYFWQPGYSNSIAVDLSNVVWCCGGGGLWSFDGITWTNYNTGNSGILSNIVNDVIIDNSNNVWVATGAGVSRFNGSYWTNYTSSNGLLDNNIRCISKDGSGNILAGSMNGVNVFNGFSWTGNACPYGPPETINADNYGNIWIGIYNYGIGKFDGTHWVHYTSADGLVGNFVSSIMIDDNNNKWIGTRTGVSKASCYNLIPSFTSDTVCFPPSSVTTIINTTQDTDATTYFWWDYNYDGFYETSSHDLQYQFPSYGIHKVTLMAVNDNCISTGMNEVVVGSLPVVTLNYSGNINLCRGNSLLLESTINNYDTVFSYTYEWNHNSNNSYYTADTSGNYFVTVHNATCIGQSNTVNVNLIVPYANQQICMVTVDTLTGKNMILWEKTPGAGIEYYNIYKETAANVYQPIGNVSATQPGVFIDVNSDATIKSDRYKIAVSDSCYNQSALSPEHKTMHLNVNLAPLNRHNLIWENYEGFSFGKYYIYRATQPHQLLLIDSIQSTISSYTDTTSIPGSVYYLVVIKKTDTCHIDNFKDQTQTYNTSVSNMEEYQILDVNDVADNSFGLSAYPNPYSNNTNIVYSLPEKAHVKLVVFNMLGEIVKEYVDESQDAGNYNYSFSAKQQGYTSGMYYLKLDVNGIVTVKKLIETK